MTESTGVGVGVRSCVNGERRGEMYGVSTAKAEVPKTGDSREDRSGGVEDITAPLRSKVVSKMSVGIRLREGRSVL